METNDETQQRLSAIQGFILKSTIPILVERKEGKPDPVGTGTLLTINGRHFIITARHLFADDWSALEHLAVPDALDGDTYTRILNLVCSTPKNGDVDIAILEVTNPESVREIKANWNFLTLENVDVSASATNVWIVGYPGKNYSIVGKRLVAEPVTVLTERLRETPKAARQPVHQGLDLFYAYGKSAHLLGKGDAPTPELQGMSGTAIWDVSSQPHPGELWLPERFAKMIGVQVAFLHGDYARAKSWLAVARSLAKIDPELRAAVLQKTGVTAE
ncbi:MAG: trypsin-like peptidase domain-containing protein [Rhizobiales bacterium]|nr:trypsin-like peptidase domain-containing protein [Hyphomicrobiales bacterium]